MQIQVRKLFCYLFIFFICLPALARDETYALILSDIFYPGFNEEQNQLLKKQILEGDVEIFAMVWQPPKETYDFGWEPLLCVNNHGYKNCVIEHGYPKIDKRTYSRGEIFAETQKEISVDKNKIIFTVKNLKKKNFLSAIYIKVNNKIILNNSKIHAVDSQLYLPIMAQSNYLTTDLNKDFLIARFELIRPQKKSFFKLAIKKTSTK